MMLSSCTLIFSVVFCYWISFITAVVTDNDNYRYIVKYKEGLSPDVVTTSERKRNNVVVKALNRFNAEVLIIESQEELQRLQEDNLVDYIEKGRST